MRTRYFLEFYIIIIPVSCAHVPIPKVWDGVFFSTNACCGVNFAIYKPHSGESEMKKLFTGLITLQFLIPCLTGCTAVGDKSADLSIIYGTAALLSLVLLVGCLFSVREKRFWFIALFFSVLVVNVGYALLSVSSHLKMALWANRVSYLGSVFLPLSMLMIILNVTNTPYKKRIPSILFGIAVIVFLIAASPGILPIYYKQVTFAVVDGVSTLVKDYGPLHPIYLVYLLGYFAGMIAVIIHANIHKTIETTAHAIIIAIAVFVNIGVWFIEQLVAIDFEMLSVSYIISELFLLGVHLVTSENQRLREIVKQVETVNNYPEDETAVLGAILEKPIEPTVIAPERIETFMAGLKTLTPSEKAIYDAYIARLTTKEVMASMNIKESTLKYHNRNLYSKLGVPSRKELLEVHKQIKSVKANLK
jgi:DNA-binding CsgD family transcriptional regulator